MERFKDFIAEGKKTYGKLILIKQMNMDGDEMVVLEFQDYSEDSPLDAEVELNDLEIKKIGNLAYRFSDGYGQLDYPLDVTKDQEKEIKNIIKEQK
jgi:hypothetical protein